MSGGLGRPENTTREHGISQLRKELPFLDSFFASLSITSQVDTLA